MAGVAGGKPQEMRTTLKEPPIVAEAAAPVPRLAAGAAPKRASDPRAGVPGEARRDARCAVVGRVSACANDGLVTLAGSLTMPREAEDVGCPAPRAPGVARARQFRSGRPGAGRPKRAGPAAILTREARGSSRAAS